MDRQVEQILDRLKELGNPEHAKSLAYFGIEARYVLGIRLPELRKLAKEMGKQHALALNLWEEPWHEAKLLATLLADPKELSLKQADAWVHQLYSWDVCDQLCAQLFRQTSYAWQLPERWTPSEEEYVRRAGLVMVAQLAIHYKQAPDKELAAFLPLLKNHAGDTRNFVKKAVSWALREIGKRRPKLYAACLQLCEELLQTDSKSAHWIARDALRELKKESTLLRLEKLKRPD